MRIFIFTNTKMLPEIIICYKGYCSSYGTIHIDRYFVRFFMDIDAILDDLTEGGLTHNRWMAMQRIVGDAEQSGDTAYVEVSFISQETGKQYYNKWGLRKMNDRWKIFSFHALKENK